MRSLPNLFAAELSSFSSEPVKKEKYMIKSLQRDQIGYLNVAGLFFSKKKWPTHAKEYPANGT